MLTRPSNRFDARDLWQKDHDHFLHPWTHFDSFKKEGSMVVVEGEGAAELPHGDEHLALRAFALVAAPERYRFRFVNRIPLERGLGSSAATIAAGLVAGAAAAGRQLSGDELLELGLPLEGHPDNLAAAIRGGVCLIWRNGDGRHAARIATDLPLAPVVVVPQTRVNTLESRGRLPHEVSHATATDGATYAALLGAAIASGDATLLAAAFHDRLHEPFRLPDAPVLAELQRDPVAGQVGVTLSGSGPSVVVWVDKARPLAGTVDALERRFPDARVLPLAIAEKGAH